jgi:hypothetical protein
MTHQQEGRTYESAREMIARAFRSPDLHPTICAMVSAFVLIVIRWRALVM